MNTFRNILSYYHYDMYDIYNIYNCLSVTEDVLLEISGNQRVKNIPRMRECQKLSNVTTSGAKTTNQNTPSRPARCCRSACQSHSVKSDMRGSTRWLSLFAE